MKRHVLMLLLVCIFALVINVRADEKTESASNFIKEKGQLIEKREAWGATWSENMLSGKDSPDAPIFWDFESDPYFTTVPAYASSWQWGAPTSGPGSAYSGTNCWATVLDGDYEPSIDWTLTMPSEDFSGVASPKLGFYHWYYTETSFDSGWVEVSINGGGDLDKSFSRLQGNK